MPMLPPLPPPTVQDVIDGGMPMHAQCRICKEHVTWTTEDLEQLLRVKPGRAKLLAVELFNVRRCPRCETLTLTNGHLGSPYAGSDLVKPWPTLRLDGSKPPEERQNEK